MAINVLCPKCKSGYALGTKVCRKCGNNLQKNRKYRVDVKGSHRATRTVDTLEIAKQLEAKFEQDAFRRDELGIVAPPTLQEVWEKFYENAKLSTKAPEYYEKFWRNHISTEFSGKRLNEIKPTDVDRFAAKLQAKSHKLSPNAKGAATKPLALSTVANILKTIRSLYGFAIRKGLYAGMNPAQQADLPRYDNRMTNSLADEELARLLKTLRTWPNRMTALGLMMCLVTGKRTGEVFGLTWDDVDFETDILRFEIKSRLKCEYQHLPMNKLSREVLIEAQAHTIPGCPLVFHTERGKLIHYWAIWSRIKKAAGLRKCIRPHDLRHTFASRLASSGEVDIFTLQNLLGHKTIAMTKRYTHLLDSALKKGIMVADKVFK